MGATLLVDEQIDAGADFVREFNDYAAVSVACWVIPADSDSIYLYIASDDIDDGNVNVAYGEVQRRLRGKRSPWLDPFQIKLVNSSDPVAQDAMRIRDRYSAPLVTRYDGTSIGGTSIDGACIYPTVTAMKSTP